MVSSILERIRNYLSNNHMKDRTWLTIFMQINTTMTGSLCLFNSIKPIQKNSNAKCNCSESFYKHLEIQENKNGKEQNYNIFCHIMHNNVLCTPMIDKKYLERKKKMNEFSLNFSKILVTDCWVQIILF